MVAVSVDVVLGGRSITEPRLDPAGRRLAYVVADGDGPRLVVVDLDDQGERVVAARSLDDDGNELEPGPAPGRGLGGGAFDWTPDGSAIVFAGTDGGLWLVSADDIGDHAEGSCRRLRRLWPAAGEELEGPGAQAPMVSPDGRFVAFTTDLHDVVIVAADGFGTPLVVTDAGGPDFVNDVVWHPDGDAIDFQGWSVPDMAWDGAVRYRALVRPSGAGAGIGLSVGGPLRVIEQAADAALQQPGFLADGTAVDICDATGWLNVWVGDTPAVGEPFEHAGPTWGPRQRSWVASPDGRFIAFTRNERGFGRLCAVDRFSGSVHELARGVHGQLSWQGQRLAALRSGAKTPTQVVVYDVATLGAEPPARTVVAVGPDPVWGELPLGEPVVVIADAPDGTRLHARRYQAWGRRRGLLVWVHGGPTGQWDVGFLPGVAFWASRGWDVLVVDPRGSTGHGRAYQQALRGQWGALDTDDTAALILHAHATGSADPATTAIMGGSSGGLTVLAVAARYPDLVAAAVAAYPVSDLADLLVHSHRFELHYPLTLVGPHDTERDRARYAELSPLTYADRITTPLLVLHGTTDDVVPVAQSEALAQRIREAGGSIELHLFDGEGHGFRRPDSKRADYALVERFLDRVIPASRSIASAEIRTHPGVRR